MTTWMCCTRWQKKERRTTLKLVSQKTQGCQSHRSDLRKFGGYCNLWIEQRESTLLMKVRENIRIEWGRFQTTRRDNVLFENGPTERTMIPCTGKEKQSRRLNINCSTAPQCGKVCSDVRCGRREFWPRQSHEGEARVRWTEKLACCRGWIGPERMCMRNKVVKVRSSHEGSVPRLYSAWVRTLQRFSTPW